MQVLSQSVNFEKFRKKEEELRYVCPSYQVLFTVKFNLPFDTTASNAP